MLGKVILLRSTSVPSWNDVVLEKILDISASLHNICTVGGEFHVYESAQAVSSKAAVVLVSIIIIIHCDKYFM